jgi:hypothetical protein
VRRAGSKPGPEYSNDLIESRSCQSIKLCGRKPLDHEGKSEKIQRLDLIGSVRDQDYWFDIPNCAISEELVAVMKFKPVHEKYVFPAIVMLLLALLDCREKDGLCQQFRKCAHHDGVFLERQVVQIENMLLKYRDFFVHAGFIRPRVIW